MAKAVIGLGNPGPRYEGTRHNVGFLAVDALASARAAEPWRARHQASWTEVQVADTVLVLVKPQAFMNRSGSSVAGFVQDLGLDPSDILVAHDELDLPAARVKLKRGGGTAGHRGLESIVEHLGSTDFARLRVGIGRPLAGEDVADFVLARFSDQEAEKLGPALDEAVQGMIAWCELGVEAAMNLVNGARRAAPEGSEEPPA